jgi:enoyl-CoA hydratase/carnithine racemase
MLHEASGGASWIDLRLDRVDKRNALCHELVDRVEAACAAGEQHGARVAVLGALGPVFCAGGDRAEMHTDPVASDRLIHLLRSTSLFVIARVEGPVLGAGVSVVRRCPVAIGTPAATFALPEAAMGIFPVPAAYLEGTVSRRRLVEVGVRSATIPASEAVESGLLTSVVDPAAIDEAVARWVDCVIERPKVAADANRYWQHELDREVEERTRFLRRLSLGEAT